LITSWAARYGGSPRDYLRPCPSLSWKAQHCRALVAKALAELGGLDVLVSNADHQATFESFEDISDEESEKMFQ
jgi:NAD(P)-dependent dehydrogenase (short-subunit alcohol dehydrogenase family)